jgi:hypothetical protein
MFIVYVMTGRYKDTAVIGRTDRFYPSLVCNCIEFTGSHPQVTGLGLIFIRRMPLHWGSDAWLLFRLFMLTRHTHHSL